FQSQRSSPPTFIDRFRACVHQPDVTRLSDGLAKYAGPLHEAGERAEPFPFDRQALATATRELAAARAAVPVLDPETARALAGRLGVVAAELARIHLQDEATEQQIAKDNREVIDTAHAELVSAATALADPPKGTWPVELDRRAAETLIA